MGRYAPDNAVSALLLAALATALAALGAGVYARAAPGWQPYPLVAACFIVAVEAALVRYRMREGRHLSAGAFTYLAAELFALVVVMRVAATIGAGATGELEAWLLEPLAALDGALAAYLLAGLACALVVRVGLRELEVLTLAAGPPRTEYALDAEVYRARSEADEREAVARLAGAMAWGGVLAILALVAQLADLSALGGGPGSLAPAMALAGIAYLACAMMLYSRARLGMLRARWRRDETAIEGGVATSWAWQSAGLVIAAVALGLLLPRSYGAGVVELARGAAASATNLLGLAALAIGVVALGLLGLLLSIPALLLALLGGMNRLDPPTTPITPIPPPPPPTPTTTFERSLGPGIVFWACMALLAGYAIWTVLRRQAWAVAAFERLRAGVLAPALAWLRRFWGGAAGYARLVGEPAPEPWRRPEPPALRAVPRLRLRALSPSELVRLYYALLLRRADELHQGRRPAETPSEYRARLGGALPEAEGDLARLTETYITAAYAPRPATPDEARAARGLWARLRRRLRRQA